MSCTLGGCTLSSKQNTQARHLTQVPLQLLTLSVLLDAIVWGSWEADTRRQGRLPDGTRGTGARAPEAMEACMAMKPDWRPMSLTTPMPLSADAASTLAASSARWLSLHRRVKAKAFVDLRRRWAWVRPWLHIPLIWPHGGHQQKDPARLTDYYLIWVSARSRCKAIPHKALAMWPSPATTTLARPCCAYVETGRYDGDSSCKFCVSMEVLMH